MYCICASECCTCRGLLGTKTFLFCSEQEGGRASDSIQEPLSPSSIGSHESLPSVRVVDGSSDNCSIHSNDINSDEQERKKVISSAAPRTHLPLFGENIISVQVLSVFGVILLFSHILLCTGLTYPFIYMGIPLPICYRYVLIMNLTISRALTSQVHQLNCDKLYIELDGMERPGSCNTAGSCIYVTRAISSYDLWPIRVSCNSAYARTSPQYSSQICIHQMFQLHLAVLIGCDVHSQAHFMHKRERNERNSTVTRKYFNKAYKKRKAILKNTIPKLEKAKKTVFITFSCHLPLFLIVNHLPDSGISFFSLSCIKYACDQSLRMFIPTNEDCWMQLKRQM